MQDRLRDSGRLAQPATHERRPFYEIMVFGRPDTITIESGHFYLIPPNVISLSFFYDVQGEQMVAISAGMLVQRLDSLADPSTAVAGIIHVLAEEASQLSPAYAIGQVPEILTQRPHELSEAIFDTRIAIQQHKAIRAFLKLAGVHPRLLQGLAEASITYLDQLESTLQQGRAEETEALVQELLAKGLS